MHHVMLNASTFSSPSLSFDYREHPSDNSHIFLYPSEIKTQKSSQCLFPTRSHPGTSLYPLCTHFPCKTRARPTRTPPVLFSLWSTTSDTSESEEKLPSRQRNRESNAFLFTCSLSHQSPLHTNTGELVLTYWNGRRSNASWLYLHGTAFLHLAFFSQVPIQGHKKH